MPGRQTALERETQCRWSMAPTSSEGMAAGTGESDRAARALTPGNAGRAKGPDLRRAVGEAAERDISESLAFRRKAAAFSGWHEPDKSRGLRPVL